ncbi:BatA domain-containing protein, partial [Dokdonella sp.]|uniref:BatA domain-containing protein n=1 Tax=Dokdonella sp. TaxID=2291710 RepID=UPI002F3EDEAA
MSIALLAPLGLVALAAWALPILVHLVRRLQLERTEFAALRWIAVDAQPRRRVRFERPWLLLVRLLLLAALALLLAQPVRQRIDAR